VWHYVQDVTLSQERNRIKQLEQAIAELQQSITERDETITDLRSDMELRGRDRVRSVMHSLTDG